MNNQNSTELSIEAQSPAFLVAGVSGSARIRSISKRLGLSGNNISFYPEPFFGLLPNSEVVQIGNGKENGVIRTDKFAYPVKYLGSIICQFSEKEKMFAFMLPEKPEGEDVFLLYGSTGDQIFTEHQDYVRVYAPEFILADR